MRLGKLASLAAGLLPVLVKADVLSLSDLSWTLRNDNGSIVIPAKVPSQSHLDLLDAGIINEPTAGINEYTERWVLSDNWTYTADLTPLTKHVAKDAKTLLVFYGLDTIANITVAGHPVAWVDNQFRQWVYDVTDLIASPVNNDKNVTVAFESAWIYGQNVSSSTSHEWVPTGNLEYPNVRQWIRKTQSDFGWNWGPAFIPSGIHKPAYLVTLTPDAPKQTKPASHPLLASTGSVFLEETSLEITKVGQTTIARVDQTADWVVNVTLAVRSVVAARSPTITIKIPELGVDSGPLAVGPIPASTNASTFVRAYITVPRHLPKLWYPHNLGTPHLYNFTVELALSKGDVAASFTTTSGFRVIELVQTPYSQQDIEERGITPGDQWHFEVNGKEFYAKGSNLIPIDPFYARVTTDQVRWILESAALSGQNIVRIWGGGQYQPSDELTGGYDYYSICDELGILAWSELIFADSLYPIDEFMLATIEPEVRENVRRINRHPSHIQWAGGNEMEVSIVYANFTLPTNGTHYVDEYVFLFWDFLRNIVLEEQSSVAYTDSSTTGGVISWEPYEARFVNLLDSTGFPDHIYGNYERYNFTADVAFDYSSYPSTRFMNEFGFMSMSSFYSWEDALLNAEDFSFNSTVVASRDRHPDAGNISWPNPVEGVGQGEMTAGVQMWLPTPNTTNSNQTFEQWCWSTQVFQSMNMISEIAWYRRGAGRGENNLGALVWQLNEIWQGISLSSIEYSGRWKVLQYGMANIYSPVTIYPFYYANNETLEVVVTSDAWEPVKGTAELTWYEWSGKKLESKSLPFEVPSLNNSEVHQAQGLQNIVPATHNATDVFLIVSLTAEVNGRTVAHEQYFTPSRLPLSNLLDPRIELTGRHDLTFTLSAKGGVAAYAWVDHPRGVIGYFVDAETNLPANGLFLLPGHDRTLKFIVYAGLSTDKHPKPADFVVRSLWNNTHL